MTNVSLKGDKIMGRGLRLGFYKILMGIRSIFIIIFGQNGAHLLE